MRANRAFHLIVSRNPLQPAFLADEDRRDRIEVVSIEDGEVVLYWEVPAAQASRMVKTLKGDLAQLEADAFIERWQAADY